MNYTREFGQLSMKDIGIAGGKGASLGEMTNLRLGSGRQAQAGIPVSPGFVVLADSFEEFLKANELHEEIQAQLDKVNHQEMESVEEASRVIQALILNAEMPAEISKEIEKEFEELDAEFVAVRSSATAEDGSTASWAGELDSFLNTTKATLLENVRKCWASLFTPRAIFYGFEKGFHQSSYEITNSAKLRNYEPNPTRPPLEKGRRKSDISVAVVVQKMVNSEISGIAFSVHPVTEDPNQLIIEAGIGLGEAIVSGSITPDNYVVDKRDWSIVDSYISDQERAIYRKNEGGNEWRDIESAKREIQKLDNEKIIELAKLVAHIEKHYGFPCDIEWAMEDGNIYIVQSRPITTLSK